MEEPQEIPVRIKFLFFRDVLAVHREIVRNRAGPIPFGQEDLARAIGGVDIVGMSLILEALHPVQRGKL